MPNANPEIGRQILWRGLKINLHDVGSGRPVIFIHGSGPGVSAYANWRLTMPSLAPAFRVIAPDMLGFGYSETPQGFAFDKAAWVDQVIGLMDALQLEQADLVGNSFGGAIALATAVAHPQRVRRLVLMGSVGLSFPITPGLEAVWGYEPSLEAMRALLDLFAFDRTLVTDELAELRHRASLRPGVQEAFRALFPAPRQRWVDALATPEEAVRALSHPTLIVHGREDRVIPLEASLRLMGLIPRAQLHVFGQCGHWTQIEHAARFARLLEDFFTEA